MKKKPSRNQTLRLVWTHLSKHPHSSVRETAEATGLCTETVTKVRYALRDLKFIDWVPGTHRTTRVLIRPLPGTIGRNE